MPDELKPNSYNSRASEDEKKVEKVISGTAKTRKRGKAHRFADVFLAEDIKDVKSYIWLDVIVPAIKDGIVDTIQKATEMFFYGKTRSSSRSRTSYTSYSSYSKPNGARALQARPVVNFDDIILETREDAENVRDILEDLLERYGKVTVGDVYDAAGITGNGYTDRYHGWTDLSEMRVTRVREGYLLEMPRVREL